MIIKIRNFDESHLSPFRFQQKELYGLTFEDYMKTIDELSILLKKNPVISTPEFIQYGNEPTPHQITTFMNEPLGIKIPFLRKEIFLSN